jgi:hypothetical protein
MGLALEASRNSAAEILMAPARMELISSNWRPN